MASGPTISWEIDGETVETVSDFIFLGSKITTDGDCSHEIKRCLLLGRKVITNLDSIMEKAMAPHSGTLAWKIPWTQEPGRLQSMGSRRIGHSWATSLSLFTFMHWRRKWQPTPVFLPRESQGWGSLMGCCPWGRKSWTRLKRLSSSSSSSSSRQHIQKQRHYFANKGLSSQSYGFSSSHVWMWELDYKESWVPKNWCFWTMVLKKTLERPLDCKEFQPVHPKGDQSWVFIGRTDLKLKLQYFGHLMWRADSLKRPWCWERLKAGGEGDDRGWDGWMASLTQWTWVWVNSRSWQWIGRPGVLQSMGITKSQTRLSDWTELMINTQTNKSSSFKCYEEK